MEGGRDHESRFGHFELSRFSVLFDPTWVSSNKSDYSHLEVVSDPVGLKGSLL